MSDGARVLAICDELGFAGAGIAEASPSKWGAEFRAWLKAGRNGSMAYLERNVEERLDPGRVLPGARAVIMVADGYAGRGEQRQDGLKNAETRAVGRIARYARGRDYHVEMKKRLHALCDRLRAEFAPGEFRAFVDTAPVLEREYAARAGLGWVGKHTLLIHPRRGSWMFLGGVVTTLELEESGEPEPDHCGTCTRCIDACPTKAISPYSVDASRCISYLTIERREAIGAEFHGAIGEWLFGCDVCQEVCPHNSARARGEGEDAVWGGYAPKREGFDLLAVLGWTEEDRRREFQSSALKRATLAMMKRNAVIVGGNVLAFRDEPALRERIQEIAADEREPEMVRRTASEVLLRLGPSKA